MVRIVLDTNVIVSALKSPRGNEARVLRLALAGGFALCVSAAILREYEGVLRRPRFGFAEQMVDAFMDEMMAIGVTVKPRARVSASPDEDDNRFLECAESAGARFLVSGNARHFPREWKGTRVVNARELLEETLGI